jgi:hypothetical protein
MGVALLGDPYLYGRKGTEIRRVGGMSRRIRKENEIDDLDSVGVTEAMTLIEAELGGARPKTAT